MNSISEPLVFSVGIAEYDASVIREKLPPELFSDILPGQTIVLKPNWVKESHLRKPDEWEYVITHPSLITAVLGIVCSKLSGTGRVIIADAPQTDSSFKKIISRYPVEEWKKMAATHGVTLEILDLREDEWIQEEDIVVSRTKLPGDPRGSTEVNLLGEKSEFFGHRKSPRGYYGADYNLKETNEAHDGFNNRYRLSRSVIEADLFINLPKLKTHKKAGITCCLKNLVGINTYKNFLPHHSEGGPAESGDQFPGDNLKSRFEGTILGFVKQHLLGNPQIAAMMKPLGRLSRKVFGRTEEVVRSGNWYGNDTLWRMTLDLNKACFYADPDGSMREGIPLNAKKYIGIVDAILAGEGNGPLAPDPKVMGRIIAGRNPVAIDAVCATMMGFDPLKIPTIVKSFDVRYYPVTDFRYENIQVKTETATFALNALPEPMILYFKPHFAWLGHIEK